MTTAQLSRDGKLRTYIVHFQTVRDHRSMHRLRPLVCRSSEWNLASDGIRDASPSAYRTEYISLNIFHSLDAFEIAPNTGSAGITTSPCPA